MDQFPRQSLGRRCWAVVLLASCWLAAVGPRAAFAKRLPPVRHRNSAQRAAARKQHRGRGRKRHTKSVRRNDATAAAALFDVFANLRCSRHVAMQCQVSTLRACEALCTSRAEGCTAFSLERAHGRCCFLFDHRDGPYGMHCDRFEGWTSGRRKASFAMASHHAWSAVSGLYAQLVVDGLGMDENYVLRVVETAAPSDNDGDDDDGEPCADHRALACTFATGAARVDPSAAEFTSKAVLCARPGNFSVCAARGGAVGGPSGDEPSPSSWALIGTIEAAANPLPGFMPSLRRLRQRLDDEAEGDDENTLQASDAHRTRRAEGRGRRGIVMCVGGSTYLTNAFVTIAMLRKVGCTLPIEIFHVGDEITEDAKALFAARFGDVVFRDALRLLTTSDSNGVVLCDEGAADFSDAEGLEAEALKGFAMKPFALLRSRFDEVLLLDADSSPLVDPEVLFRTPQYLHYGSTFWLDFNGNSVKNGWYRALGLQPPHSSDAGKHGSAADAAKEHTYRSESGRDIESGQFLLDKREHGDVVEYAWFINCNGALAYRFQHGDKDTYRQAFGLARKEESFFSVAYPPRGGFESKGGGGEYKLVAMLQPMPAVPQPLREMYINAHARDWSEEDVEEGPPARFPGAGEPAFVHRTALRKFGIGREPAAIDAVSSGRLLTVEFTRHNLVDLGGMFTLGLKKRIAKRAASAGDLGEPGPLLEWHSSFSMELFREWEALVARRPHLVPAHSKALSSTSGHGSDAVAHRRVPSETRRLRRDGSGDGSGGGDNDGALQWRGLGRDNRKLALWVVLLLVALAIWRLAMPKCSGRCCRCKLRLKRRRRSRRRRS